MGGAGENAFSKKTFPILSFSEKELANGELFRNKLAVLLSEYAFTKDFGIIENSQLDLIIKSLDQKDLQIKKLDSSLINVESDAKEKGEIIKNLSVSVKKLQEESQLKDKELTNLKKGVSDIKDYASVARLNLFGLEHTYAYPLKFETELSNLMEKAIYVKSNQVLFYVNDSAIQWLTIAIEKYPKFPFSYYAMFEILLRMNKKKCLEYAYNCIEILKITTTIEGHHKQHDDALKQLIGTVADIEQHRPIIIMEKDKPVLVNPIN